MIGRMFQKFTRIFGSHRLSVVVDPAKSSRKPAGKPSAKSALKSLSPIGYTLPQLRNRACQWQAQGQKNASFSSWRCATCGVEAFSRTGAAPKQCKKGLDGRL